MLDTIFIYTTLMFVTIWGAYVSSKKRNEKHIGAFAIVLLFVSLIIGGRYEVGTDWPNYFEYYNYFTNYYITIDSIVNNHLEPLYTALNALCASLGFSPSMFFTTVALIIFLLLYYSICDEKKILPWVFFFFFTQLFFMSMNIQRQILAVGFFLLGTKYIDKSKIKSLLLIGCACLFHYSTFALIPFVFIGHKVFAFLENRKIALLLFFITFIFKSIILQLFYLLPIGNYMNDKYLANMDNLDIEMAVSSGLGIITKNVIYIIAIIYMPKLLKHYTHFTRFSSIYRLFIAGILLSNVFGISEFLSRIPLALISLSVIIYSFLCNYLFNKNSYDLKFIIGLGLVVLSFIMFIMSIINGAGGNCPFKFEWI